MGRLILLGVAIGLLSASSGVASSGRVLVITLRGHASAKRTGRVGGREAGSWTVRWRVPESQLTVGRRLISTSATVTGTASAYGGSLSCRGTLAARRSGFVLRVLDKSGSAIGFSASPSPFATAVASGCQQGVSAARWPLRTSRERKDWSIFNHPGFGFLLPDYRPRPKGGNSDGWRMGHGVTWLVTISVVTSAARSLSDSEQGRSPDLSR
jgi:hypothetical protein